MTSKKIDTETIAQAIEEHGSLLKAVGNLKKQKTSLKNDVKHLEQAQASRQVEFDKLVADIQTLRRELADGSRTLERQSTAVSSQGYRYFLFESLLAILTTSPSTEESVDQLIVWIRGLGVLDRWSSPQLADMRGLFVRAVLGHYLRSYHCRQCDASFIVNRASLRGHSGDSYICPSCHYSGKVEPDDTFLKAFLAEQQLAEIRSIEELERENAALRPFAMMHTVPCYICGQRIKEWDNENILHGLNGLGWAHTKCWNTTSGQVALAIRQVNKEGKGPVQVVLPKPVENPSNDQAPPHN